MLRVVQFLVSCSSSLNRIKHWNGLSFVCSSTRSSSSSLCKDTASLVFPLVSPRGSSCCRSFRLPSIRSDSRAIDASQSQSLPHMKKVSFCQWCGSTTKQAIPDDDDKIRTICTACGKVAYQNPKMVVGCLVEHDSKVLLCRRKIPPSYGLWTLPAGYMEIGESAVDGAARETWEEACAEVEILSPFAQIDIPLIGQTYILFRAKLKSPHISPGPESLECQLFSVDDIPFDSLAFSSMLVTLNLYIEDMKAGKFKFHYCIINKRPGTGASDIRDFTLDYHLQC